MTAIRTNHMRVHLAEQFFESLTEAAPNNYYMFLGKVSAWDTEPVAEVPTTTFEQDDVVHWADMLGGEKIPATAVTHVVRRYDWETGVIFDQYDDQDTALFTKQFYVLTDELNVYKCIDKNNGAVSTVKPTGTATSILDTADGYRWKFLYTSSGVETTKFLIPAWMPIKFWTANDGSDQWLVQQAAVAGKFERAEVTAGGSGYTAATVAITGDGAGATADAVVVAGEVTEVNVTNAGSGYTFYDLVISGDGTGATARLINSPGLGHGDNPLTELGAFFIMMAVEFAQDEGGTLPTDNDFRKVGILKDPLDFGTTDLATLSNYKQTTAIQLDVGFTGTYIIDEVLTGLTSGATAIVVGFDAGTRILQVNEKDIEVFVDGETVTSTSGSGVISTSGVGNPDLEPASGTIIYIDQRASVSRAIDQTETMKTIFEF